MKKSLLTILRDKRTGTAAFRRAAHTVSGLLALETFQYITEQTKPITTPVGKTTGYYPKQHIVLVPVLRAGLALLPAFLHYFEDARVGFVGFKRDETTAEAHEYYRNIPKITSKDIVILLDPMIATGGSSIKATEAILKAGAKQESIIAVFLVSAPEGIAAFKKEFPRIKIVIGTEDERLNSKKYIVPGLGDFGDRYFGTV